MENIMENLIDALCTLGWAWLVGVGFWCGTKVADWIWPERCCCAGCPEAAREDGDE